MVNRFNISIYGICIQGSKILLNQEQIKGKTVVKFPGGGLHLGEGIVDCLKREWKEELNIDIEVAGHFYTTDFFQLSAFDNSQVISIYYFVTVPKDAIIINNESNERTYWAETSEINAKTFTLAIDKIVGGMLQDHLDR